MPARFIYQRCAQARRKIQSSMRLLGIFGFIILLGQSSLVFGQSQAQLVEDSDKRLKSAEAEMKSVYNRILANYRNDIEFVKNLKESQDAWRKFSRADLWQNIQPEKPDIMEVRIKCVLTTI